jgi:hypothetical protein
MNAIQNIGIGVLLMIFGIFIIWYTSKRPKNTSLSSINNFQGYASGVGFIIFGIIYILNKLHLWW